MQEELLESRPVPLPPIHPEGPTALVGEIAPEPVTLGRYTHIVGPIRAEDMMPAIPPQTIMLVAQVQSIAQNALDTEGNDLKAALEKIVALCVEYGGVKRHEHR